MKLTAVVIMFSAATVRSTAAFVATRSSTAFRRTISSSAAKLAAAESGQAEVVLVGCGAPNRGMGWYHAVQMLDKK